MRLQIFSDVHFDAMPAFIPALVEGADIVVVAGDVCEGIEQGFHWLRRHIRAPTPIVFVAGNHEFYRRCHAEERQAGRLAARRHGIVFLDSETRVIDGVRFIGATLWSDFAFFGDDLRHAAMDVARRCMLDHRLIRRNPAGDRFQPEDARQEHLAARHFLERALARRHRGPTVVVTHHGPHEGSVAPQYREDPVTAAFVSDLSALIEARQPALWVHGHTHVSFDYRIRATRIVCNPHGYGTENRSFDPELVVEV